MKTMNDWIKTGRFAGLLALIAGMAQTGTAAGQSLEVSVLFGGFGAPTELGSISVAGTADGVGFDASLGAEHLGSEAYGTRVTYWASEGFGIEGSLMYAPTDLATTQTVRVGGAVVDEEDDEDDARIWATSARALFSTGASDPLSANVGAGVAVVGRGGDAYDDIEGTTDIGATLGVGARFQLGHLKLRLDVDGLFYKARLSGSDEDIGDFQSESKLQSDLVYSIGVVIPIF